MQAFSEIGMMKKEMLAHTIIQCSYQLLGIHACVHVCNDIFTFRNVIKGKRLVPAIFCNKNIKINGAVDIYKDDLAVDIYKDDRLTIPRTNRYGACKMEEQISRETSQHNT